MCKPTNEMIWADAQESIPNAAAELFGGSKCELAKVVFDETPAQLDGTEIWRVGREKHELCAFGLDELAD